jgi:hypothetical protein
MFYLSYIIPERMFCVKGRTAKEGRFNTTYVEELPVAAPYPELIQVPAEGHPVAYSEYETDAVRAQHMLWQPEAEEEARGG